jgi:hypothetical protein
VSPLQRILCSFSFFEGSAETFDRRTDTRDKSSTFKGSPGRASMFLQATLAVGVGSLGYLRYVGLMTGPQSVIDLAAKSGDGALAAKLAGASAAVLALNFAEWSIYGDSGNGPISRSVSFFLSLFGQEKRRKIVVNDWIDEYNRLHKSEESSERNSAYSKLVNYYYELATLFYEVGWCPSFHFAYRMPGESFAESIRRHEYYLAGFLGLKPGSKVISLHVCCEPVSRGRNSLCSRYCFKQVLDVGCGIGGPYRNIGRFTKWDITGVSAVLFRTCSFIPKLMPASAGYHQ